MNWRIYIPDYEIKTSQGNRLLFLKEAQIIGQGTFGCVVAGTLIKQKQDIAIAAKFTIIDSRSQQKLAKQELKNLWEHSQNIGVVRIFDDAEIKMESSRIKIFIMQKCDMPLSQYIKQNKAKLNYQFVMTVIMQLIEAIRQLHQKGTVHRDLKESNVLVIKYGNNAEDILLKLADLGLSLEIKKEQKLSSEKTSNQIAGKIEYLAPQAIQNPDTSDQNQEKIDVWAFIVIVYKILFKTNKFIDEGQQATYTIQYKQFYKKQVEQAMRKALSQSQLNKVFQDWKFPDQQKQFLTNLICLMMVISNQDRFNFRQVGERGQKTILNLFKNMKNKYYDRQKLVKAHQYFEKQQIRRTDRRVQRKQGRFPIIEQNLGENRALIVDEDSEISIQEYKKLVLPRFYQ